MKWNKFLAGAVVIVLIPSVILNIRQGNKIQEYEMTLLSQTKQIMKLEELANSFQSKLAEQEGLLEKIHYADRRGSLSNEKPKYELVDRQDTSYKGKLPRFFRSPRITTPDPIRMEGAKAERALRDKN